MKVLLIDDHEVLWSGMRAVAERLATEQRPNQIFEWQGVKDVAAARALTDRSFDLILLDYHLPEIKGVEAFKAIRQIFESPPIVMISGDESPQAVRAAIEAGAAGYIPKTMSEEQMVKALTLVLGHGLYLPRSALLDAHAPTPGAAPMVLPSAVESFISHELSVRQREVFARALRGMPNKLIAQDLGIAEGTVKVHLAMVFRALGVRNRTEAIYRVLAAGATSAVDPL